MISFEKHIMNEEIKQVGNKTIHFIEFGVDRGKSIDFEFICNVDGQDLPCGWGRTEREAYNDLRHWYKRRYGVSLIDLE